MVSVVMDAPTLTKNQCAILAGVSERGQKYSRRWDLLAGPDNARDPQHVGHRQRAVAVLGVERFELDALAGLALEFLDHHLAVLGLDHDPIAAPHRRRRRDYDDVAVAVGRLHRVAG